MAGFLLRPKAVADLDSIWHYTLEKWGEEQAERYVRKINGGFAHLAQKPELGRSCDNIRPGYRKYRVGHHVIFYRLLASGIDVVRVLHESMDVQRHL